MAHRDVVVVGAGLAGLVAAVRLARAGARVTCLDGAREAGGRARSRVHAGATFNLGPHALYRRGAARRALDALGVPVPGGTPPTGAMSLRGDALSALPFSPGAWAQRQAPGFVAWLAAAYLPGELSSWIWPEAGWRAPDEHGTVSAVRALLRLLTYCADVDDLEPEAVRRQVRLGLGGVTYVHGGWQRLVDALLAAAIEAGVELRLGVRAQAIRGTQVRTADETLTADAVVAAVPPSSIASLLGEPALAAGRRPVTAGCLDLLLRGVEVPHRLVLGDEPPVYVALHSDVAQLAPPGTALVHAVQYGGEDRAALERSIDRAIPGWRARLLHARWAPRLVVAHDRPYVGRPTSRLEVAPRVWWVGDHAVEHGMLADAAAGSAWAAVDAILEGR